MRAEIVGAKAALTRLEAVLHGLDTVAVAVSGGVDSMTLSHVAHRLLGERAEMYHAVSAAVPPAATRRVERHGSRWGWRLALVDAGELEDADYRANPVNRCFFCKSRLYQALAEQSTATLVSGTNLDDLGDFRPGLEAARRHGVRHPFVEAEIDKPTVRLLARHLGLGDLAELPAAPCLSSRIETGIAIRPAELRLVDEMEILVRAATGAATVRCRRRRGGVVVELDDMALAKLEEEPRQTLAERLAALVRRRGFDHRVDFAPYRRGSAFLRDAATGDTAEHDATV